MSGQTNLNPYVVIRKFDVPDRELSVLGRICTICSMTIRADSKNGLMYSAFMPERSPLPIWLKPLAVTVFPYYTEINRTSILIFVKG
jgi:hypothetical protein